MNPRTHRVIFNKSLGCILEASELKGPVKIASISTEIDKWAEGGDHKVALHTVAGLLTGGAAGALGAAAAAKAAPILEQLQTGIAQGLKDAGLSDTAAQGIAQTVAGLTAAGVGAAVGGAGGAASALTIDANNRQLHPVEQTLASQLAQRANASGVTLTESDIAAALRQAGIKGSVIGPDQLAVITNPGVTDPSVRGSRFDNQMPLTQGTGPGPLVESFVQASPQTIAFVRQATGGADSPYFWSASATAPRPTGNAPPSVSANETQQSWSYMGANSSALPSGVYSDNRTQAQIDASLSQTTGLIATSPLWIPAVGAAAIYSPLGFGLGLAGDAAGQYYQTGTVRPVQSVFSGVTGAVVLPLGAALPAIAFTGASAASTTVNVISNSAIGGATAVVDTQFNNNFFNEDTSLIQAGGVGAIAGAAGPIVGAGVRIIGGTLLPNVPRIPITGSVTPFPSQGSLNPLPSQLGNTVNNAIGTIPSFVDPAAVFGRPTALQPAAPTSGGAQR